VFLATLIALLMVSFANIAMDGIASAACLGGVRNMQVPGTAAILFVAAILQKEAGGLPRDFDNFTA